MKESGKLDRLLTDVCRANFITKRSTFSRFGLHRGQPPLLFLLFEKDGRTVGEISKAMGLSPATVSKMIQRMELSGFIHKRQDKSDMRVFRIYLTAKSREIEEELERTMLDVERQIFSAFSAEERDLLERFLKKLKESLSK
ncbi:MAG TPA: MarR family transcriptional regulator [Mesotoga infera]|uniref:MarR family transcriptional regulator n=1 Tax=Mesotoga infera TaxID=1236046 RepID=A0A7C1GSB3_9BACT|nr:MarR family transcriptional regulator [Mesotoga infera]